MKIEIAQCFKEDVRLLQDIAVATFVETYARHNTPENLKAYLDSSFNLARLAEELSNPDSLYFFAKTGQAVCGYVKLNFGKAQTEFQGNKAVEVERIYALKEFYGKGIGNALMKKAVEVGRQKGLGFVWLGVWQENPRAIRFYEKQGFTTFGTHAFKFGDDLQQDFLMKFSL